jgi:PAS domain S-box-containing protein
VDQPSQELVDRPVDRPISSPTLSSPPPAASPPLSQRLAWAGLATVAGALLVVGLALGLAIPMAAAIALAAVLVGAGVFWLDDLLSNRPLLRRAHELGQKASQLGKLKQDLEHRLADADTDLARTKGQLEVERAAHQKADHDARTLATELETRVADRTAELDARVREQQDQIQEHKRAADGLRENEKRYRHLVEIANVGIWTVNAEGKTNFANPKAAETLGCTVPEMLGLPPAQFIFMEDLPPTIRGLDLQRGAPSEPIEFRMRDKTGNELWVRAYFAAVLGQLGEYLGALLVFANCTSRKRAEERLRAEALLLESAQDAIVICDSNLHILSWSPSAARLYGWASEEVLGRDTFELLCQKSAPAEKETVLAGLRQRGRWRGELSQVTKQGTVLEADVRFSAAPAVPGKPASVLFLANDVTERKRAQAQLLREHRLETAGNLAAGLSHELNNALAPILLSAQILRGKQLKPDEQELAAGIEVSAQRSAELLKQAMIFARGLEGQRVLIDPTHRLREIAQIGREMFPRNVQVLAHVPAGTWSFKGDPSQLHQALLKLCVNARDAMPNGGVLWLRVANRQLEADAAVSGGLPAGPFVEIEVQDTGRGIPLAIQDRIFEPFFSTKDRCHATGLGLSIAMGIIRSHGGTIEVRSQPGAGATFSILLPAVLQKTAPPAEPPTGPPAGRGELILMVEDEAGLRDVTRTMLNQYGYQVLAASDGVEALGLLSQHQGRVKLVFTNLSMPAMDGPSLARAARRIDPHVRIIASSALGTSVQQTDKVAALQSLGISRLLAKPYTAQELLRAVRDELNEQPSG